VSHARALAPTCPATLRHSLPFAERQRVLLQTSGSSRLLCITRDTQQQQQREPKREERAPRTVATAQHTHTHRHTHTAKMMASMNFFELLGISSDQLADTIPERIVEVRCGGWMGGRAAWVRGAVSLRFCTTAGISKQRAALQAVQLTRAG